MIKLSESKDELIIGRNTYFLYGIIIAGIMSLGGAYVIFLMLSFEDIQTLLGAFAVMFLSIWEIGVIYGVVYYMREYSKHIIITKDGVGCYTWFKKEFINWNDIKDWGLSYCGQTRGEGNTYYLYFSKHECQVKNDCKKILKGKMIKAFVMGDDYFEINGRVIPFCIEKTQVHPFVGMDKFHWI